MYMNPKYSDEHHAHFEEHGYVRLGKVLDDAGLAELQQRIDAIMLGEIPYPEMEFQLDGEDADYAKMPVPSLHGHKGTTLQYRKIMGLEQDPVYLAYMQHSLFSARSPGAISARMCRSSGRCL